MNLLSVQGEGALYAILIFFLCVAVVFGYKLARIGWRSMHKKLPPEKPRKTKKAPEPVYYIVERKKKRSTKTEYTEPKRIKFQ